MVRLSVNKKTTMICLIAVIFMFSSVCLVFATDLPGKGVKVRATYAGVAQTLFQLEIALEGLRELGYEIEPITELEMVTMHVAVANGDADLLTNHWDPIHNHIFEKVGGESTVVKVGVIIDGALQGYLVDKKTAENHNIKNFEQLKDPQIAKLFDANGNGKADLVGCNPGWGCERIIEYHLDAYNLRDTVEHIQGSYFALIADTIARYNQGQPVLYFTWTPQWVSGVLEPGKDVEWLTVKNTALPEEQARANTKMADGRNLGFPVVKVWTLANKQFIEANPPARRFLEQVSIPLDDINAQNLKMKNGEDKPEDIKRHVQEWIAAHKEKFDGWVKQAAATK